MGQPEAVDAMVDLVTLVKAGLSDPNKPFGVFLFVGPTGVGKTELARAMAENLFGDPARLVRLDMSEFATYEAFERLIGGGIHSTEPGLLTSTVRERPFAVLLFDEIEKAHPNIYNLCLQIFDAGRLTDTQGRTADFRRTIVIMTSNVGSSIAGESPVGFGRKPTPTPDRDMTMRELGRWFRPEFLNRLDRIVNFRPLAVETAEKIAQREVARVLERGGITRRNLAIEVDPAVLPVLLREGYSPAFGARPLKRTVERMVLLPVARAIAEGNLPPGSLLRLVARQNRVDIEVEPPEAPEGPAPTAARALPVVERAAKLLERLRELSIQAEPLAERKSELLSQSSQPDFWNDAAQTRRIYDDIYRLDGILANLVTLEKQAQAEVERAQKQRGSGRELTRIEEHLEGLESQAEQLAFLVSCRDARALGDALVTLRLATRQVGTRQGRGLDGVPLLARMYVNFAARRGLEVQVVDDRHGGEPKEDTITLHVFGPGAFALLGGEAGIHQVSRGKAHRSERKNSVERKTSAEREMIRVEVLPAPSGTVAFSPDELQAEVKPAKLRQGRLLTQINHEIRLFHAPTMTSVHGWCDGSKTEAIDRLKTLLRARLDAQKTPAVGKPPVVRRYRLGPSAMVRDHRTGRGTARLDSVLEGHLDPFLLPPSGNG
ncbi:MAG: AAA family ATPase [Planctomycetes bacterium]|nr:AAA family ATPase [Planctomycetota bacterium]